jgi:methylated-DNA-[protein]-cysteine S-methyltransferase
MMYKAILMSDLGTMVAAADSGAVVGLWFEEQNYFPNNLISIPADEGSDEYLFHALKEWLKSYFRGENPPLNFPLAPIGCEFKQIVWKLLLEIPYGSFTTYGEIARKVALLRGIKRFSSQAVGGAVGHNPISIIIPCHRVIGASGKFTGYAGGIWRKEELLKLERTDIKEGKPFLYNSP